MAKNILKKGHPLVVFNDTRREWPRLPQALWVRTGMMTGASRGAIEMTTLMAGKVAMTARAATGIGLFLAEVFSHRGLRIMLADMGSAA